MSSQSKIIVLITGATGYIGASVLYRLLSFPDAQSRFEFRAIVRDAEKAKKLAEGFGVKTIVGSHSDKKLMEEEVAQADVILATADCDDMDAAIATNAGMKRRYESTGKRPILVHTSGTAVLVDDALGEYASDVIWEDENVAQLDSLPPDAPHRAVELEALSADQQGYAKTYIVCPSVIYGPARNPLVDAGIANSRTIMFKLQLPAILKRGYGTIAAGKGENVWCNVHIDEGEIECQRHACLVLMSLALPATDFYVLLFTSVLEESKHVPHGKEGYFFLGVDEQKSIQYINEVTRVLFGLGKVKSLKPTPLTEEEAEQYFGGSAKYLLRAIGGNARCVSNRAKRLGWKPSKTTKDFLDSIEEEVGFWLKNWSLD
ncbi:hypothetical protein V5O48_008395 [Marasmius crinis-equi]|uniref:NmrA-like domain-containing protein n=1 Tax=Marasmius crinis-equi TaxID=585013 RepID=A0ABR3FE18_9AGAR